MIVQDMHEKEKETLEQEVKAKIQARADALTQFKQVRSGQVKSGQVRSGQVKSGQIRSGQVRSGQVRQ